MDLNAAGLLREAEGETKLSEVPAWRQSDAFSSEERLVLEYAEAMVRTDLEVDDELFAALRQRFSEAEAVQLTAWICLEDFYSKFNVAFRVESQGFCPLPHR